MGWSTFGDAFLSDVAWEDVAHYAADALSFPSKRRRLKEA
jgi:hypothetical protein